MNFFTSVVVPNQACFLPLLRGVLWTSTMNINVIENLVGFFDDKKILKLFSPEFLNTSVQKINQADSTCLFTCA